MLTINILDFLFFIELETAFLKTNLSNSVILTS